MKSVNRERAMSAKKTEEGNLHRDNAAEIVLRVIQFLINSLLRVTLRAHRAFAAK